MASFSAGGNAYDDKGDGDTTFLFVPGWCGPRTYFGPLADRLSTEHRTLAMDWRGHGDSQPAAGDFGVAELVDDAMSVIDASGARTVIPVAAAHAGGVAIDLRRRLGAERIAGVVFLDWMVLGAPAPFLGRPRAVQYGARRRAGLSWPRSRLTTAPRPNRRCSDLGTTPIVPRS
jgi:pimeloyl-ACP methyl ester carboxylesterase